VLEMQPPLYHDAVFRVLQLAREYVPTAQLHLSRIHTRA
jgi:hypothetical protein